MSRMLDALHSLHFIRPQWFWALVPIALLLIWMWHRRLRSGAWRRVVAPELLPYVLVGGSASRPRWPWVAAALGAVLAVTALAGPAWEKIRQPVFRRQSALVVLLDLSRSMDAADVYPSRLRRARQKLVDILQARKEGRTALVVYAAEPFVVSPLTDDSHTIISQLSALTTDLMPAQGSRLDLAIKKAIELLRQAGMTQGHVLAITDGVDGSPPEALQGAVAALRRKGGRLSLLGVGTPQGAPIPQPGGGFVKDASGAIVVAKLDPGAITAVARAGGGIARFLSPDDSDTRALVAEFSRHFPRAAERRVEGLQADRWRDEGPWLLLPLLALGLACFRRGFLGLALLFLVPLPRPAEALDWQHLWQRDDQLAQQAFERGDHQRAAKLFHDPAWRAAAHYRAGDYAAALQDLKSLKGAQAAYNRGNALARLNRLAEAIEAYDQALRLDPQMEDARYNRDLVRKRLQSQQQENGDNKKGKSGGEKQSRKPANQDHRGGEERQNPPEQPRQDGAKPHQGGQNASSPRNPDDSGRGDRKPRSGGSSDRHADKSDLDEQAKESNPMNPDEARGENPAGASRAGQPERGSVPRKEDDREAREREKALATEQWLRRIPDDPGGLWRRKFLYQYRRVYQSRGKEAQPW